MSFPVAFWDSSALVPLCTRQAETATARRLYKNYGMVVWWAAPVEIVSALTRVQRTGGIGTDQFVASRKAVDDLAKKWNVVMPSSMIGVRACSLLETYPLRAADALQLAAALAWCEGKPKGRIFLSFDQKLREAALLTGFTLP